MKAPECTSFSPAHTTPILRSKENPAGDETLGKVWYANTVRLLVRRLLTLISKGAHVLVENPQMSYLWLMKEMLVLFWIKGIYIVRIDQCCFEEDV